MKKIFSQSKIKWMSHSQIIATTLTLLNLCTTFKMNCKNIFIFGLNIFQMLLIANYNSRQPIQFIARLTPKWLIV